MRIFHVTWHCSCEAGTEQRKPLSFIQSGRREEGQAMGTESDMGGGRGKRTEERWADALEFSVFYQWVEFVPRRPPPCTLPLLIFSYPPNMCALHIPSIV